MKRLAIFILLFLCVGLSAQTVDDANRLATYALRINYFNQLCPQEKVYLHLDNTAYFQGETIWYAANVVDATTGGEAASKVLYVELLSPTGVVLKQQKLKVINGRCHGSFPLIDNDVKDAVEMRGAIGYPSGYYQIRAYTRTMLNFDDAGVFSRVIPVYKEPKTEGDYADPVMERYTYHEVNRPDPKRSEKLDKFNMTFYPEGGHLVSGLPCRIAFKATDKQGHGVNIEALTDNDGNTLSIPLQHNGMGSFSLTPDKTNRKVQAIYGGKKYSFTLPEPEPEGCTLQVLRSTSQQDNESTSGDSLIVNFAAAGLPATKLLAYTLTSQGRCHAVDTLTVGTRGCTRTLATSGLPTGVYQLTLFDAEGVVYAQRLFFVDNGIPTETVSVTADRADYRPFDEIRLNLQVASPKSSPKGKDFKSPLLQEGKGEALTFSLAVRDAADYGTAFRDDIRTYMLLSSELKGLIEDPGWYFERLSDYQTNRLADNSPASEPSPKHSSDSLKSVSLKSKKDALDLLMLVQGWTRYNWRQMAGVEPFEIRHYTEEQLVVDGWAFSRYKELPLANVKVGINLYSPDRDKKQHTIVTTDSLGYWSVGVDDFEGEWALFIQTKQQEAGKENNTTRIRLERSSKPALYAYQPIETYIPDYAWNASDIEILEEEEDTFALPADAHVLQEVEVQGRRRYIDFATFKAYDADKDTELILDEGQYTYKVYDYLKEKGYDIDYENGEYRALRTFYIAIRGNHQVRYSRAWDIDMERVKSVIFYNKRSDFLGIPVVQQFIPIETIMEVEKLYGGAYVVEIRLHEKTTRKITTKNSRHTTFAGYSPVVEFYAPTYPNGPVQGDKDYRRTIYWNPEVATDADGYASVSFFNNGYSRALTISAEGLTRDGVPIINK